MDHKFEARCSGGLFAQWATDATTSCGFAMIFFDETQWNEKLLLIVPSTAAIAITIAIAIAILS